MGEWLSIFVENVPRNMSVVVAENAAEIVASGSNPILSQFSAHKLDLFIKSYIKSAYLKKDSTREVRQIVNCN